MPGCPWNLSRDRSHLSGEARHNSGAIPGPEPPATTFAPSLETGSGCPQAGSAKGGRTKCEVRTARLTRLRKAVRGVELNASVALKLVGLH
jgi:hypothetical protein